MGILEQVTTLKNQGLSEEEIISQMQEKGMSPKMINDALNQSKIKSAISPGEDLEASQIGRDSLMREEENRMRNIEQGLAPPSPTGRQPMYSPKTKEVSEKEMYAPPQQEFYTPQPQQEIYTPSPGQEYYAPQPQQEYYPQEGYEYAPAETSDTDTLIEISEQVFSEKIKKLQKQVDEMSEFKNLAQTKIDHLAERLKKIETSLDRLQAAILEKVGSYGSGLDSIKKEMAMMQGSFGKMVNKIADKAEKKHHPVHRIEKKTTVTHRSAKKRSRKK
jgi:hypothetical protein